MRPHGLKGSNSGTNRESCSAILIVRFISSISKKVENLFLDVLKIPLAQVGILTAVPSLVEYLIAFLSSLVADRFITKGTSTTKVRHVLPFC